MFKKNQEICDAMKTVDDLKSTAKDIRDYSSKAIIHKHIWLKVILNSKRDKEALHLLKEV